MKTIEKINVTINPETKNEVTIKVLLVNPKKGEDGKYWIRGISRRFLVDKAPHYLVQILQNGKIVYFQGSPGGAGGNQEFITRSTDRYTNFIQKVKTFYEMKAWREANPAVQADQVGVGIPDEFRTYCRRGSYNWVSFPSWH